MIIWLSGAYGVGKSTLAEALKDRIENALIFDAEGVGNAVRDSYPDAPYGYIFEDYPLWSEFCCRLLAYINETFPRHFLVPLTLLRPGSYENIILRLRRAGIDTRLVILEAERETIHDRILARGEEENCWCMENIDLARAGSHAMEGYHLSTDRKPIEELAQAVQTLIFPM